MNVYKAVFNGRRSGAIGVFYKIETTVKGKNKEEAKLNLYENYEHIQRLTLTLL